ncbi:hypothetical protein HPULCUR_006913 [Helicostylum pulchrum]|uniref:Uncharacterized protein n=1 Tax=Helicostylum pulchrum TaxID=562976 RepID=A0ABP9Y3B0_9FUNG
MRKRKKLHKGKKKDTSAAASANVSAVPPGYNAPSNSTATRGSNVTPGSSIRSVSAVTPVANVLAGANPVQVCDGTLSGNSRLTDSTKRYRQLIAKHKDNYIKYADYTPPKLVNAQQISLYECTKIETAYLNNIKTHFGNRLSMFLNKLCGKKEKASEGCSKDLIKEKVREEIYKPRNQIKLSIAKKEMSVTDTLDNISKVKLQTLLSMYDTDYKFQKDSIYYNVKARPANHLKAFFKLQQPCEHAKKLKKIICFPIRTSFVPSYMTLDTKIASYHILKSKKLVTDKYHTWGQVVSLKKKVFKPQGPDKSLRFQGTLETDGIGVSVLKQNISTNRRLSGTGRQQSVTKDEYKIENIQDLTQETLNRTTDNCILIDPGRRDLMYCMHETSTVKEKKTFIFTKNNRTKLSRRFWSLRKRSQPFAIKTAGAALSETNSSSVSVDKFVQYIKTRASVKNTMYAYYGNGTTKSDKVLFPDPELDFQVDKKCNLYYESLFLANIRRLSNQ